MAIDLWSNTENSGLGFSPRISFSHDLCQTDMVAVERQRSDSLLLESNEFDFCISESFEQGHSSCADELFSDGKILPIEIKKQVLPPKPPTYPTTTTTTNENAKKESLKEIMEQQSSKTEEKSSCSKSFWRFKRSSSCGSGYTRSLICSLPLLSRSNSTGSTPTPKRSSSLKDNSTNSYKLRGPTSNAYSKSSSSSSTSSSSSSSSSYPYSASHKSSLKKNYGSYNNGVRISPVLNVPPPYISKGTVNLFGLGSLFCNGKDKNNKKKRSDFSY